MKKSSTVATPGSEVLFAVTATSLSIDPIAETVQAGLEFQVAVDVSSVSNLYAFEFDLSFNSAVLSLVGVSEGTLLSGSGTTFFLPGSIDNANGTVTGIADTMVGPGVGATGTGSVVYLDFVAKSGGSTGLIISNATLLDENLNTIAFITNDSTVDVVPCFLAGTSISTAQGETAVEKLKIGDRVRTLSGDFRSIKWIGWRSYAGAFAKKNPDAMPICIVEDALADGVPSRKLFVSPLHAMLVDNVLVPAKYLVNGATIYQCDYIDLVEYYHIDLEAHEVIFAEGAPAETFVDCDSRSMFQNASTYAEMYPSNLAPRWSFCAPRIEGGHLLEEIKSKLRARAGLSSSKTLDAQQCGFLAGQIDLATRDEVAGWAWQEDHPEQPARLEILVDDGVIGQVVANESRPDVRNAGYGNGLCGFKLALGGPLSPFKHHTIRVRRVSDGVELTNSGKVIVQGVADLDDASLRKFACSLKATAGTGPAALDALIEFMKNETIALQSDRIISRRRRGAQSSKRPIALFIDETTPVRNRDAGSNAALDHVRSLQCIGYDVLFVSRSGESSPAAANNLTAMGVMVCVPPAVSSVEEALRFVGADATLIYVHRISCASIYLPLARHYCPNARLVYSLADLHFLRLTRQAEVEKSTSLAAKSSKIRGQELAAVSLADSTITHSKYEAALLRELIPGASVHVVPWSVTIPTQKVPFKDRHGVAFIGDYCHSPNVDAARWLINKIMPLVWQRDRKLVCHLVGSNMPDTIKRLSRDGVTVVGHVHELQTIFDTVRLTVAPLRYGAGLKGKVIDSLAAGVPCVCSPIAAEGLDLPTPLRERCLGKDPKEMADAIVHLHRNERTNTACASAGADMIRAGMEASRVDEMMRRAVGAPVLRTRRRCEAA